MQHGPLTPAFMADHPRIAKDLMQLMEAFASLLWTEPPAQLKAAYGTSIDLEHLGHQSCLASLYAHRVQDRRAASMLLAVPKDWATPVGGYVHVRGGGCRDPDHGAG